MRKSIPIFLWALFFIFIEHEPLGAQPDGFENLGVYVIRVKTLETDEVIHGLKLSLVYKDGSPVCSTRYDQKRKKLLAEPYIFLENMNEVNTSKKSKRIFPYRNYFPSLDGNYLCVVPTRNGQCALSFFVTNDFHATTNDLLFSDSIENLRGFLYLKIEDLDGRRNGGYFPTRIIALPVSGVYSLGAIEQMRIYSTNENKQEIIPATVVLARDHAKYIPPPHRKGFETFVVPHSVPSPLGDDDLGSDLNEVYIIDEASRRVIQTISPPTSSLDKRVWDRGRLEFLQWKHPYFRDHRVWRIPAAWRLPGLFNRKEHDPYLYYHLNWKTHQYEPDTFLNHKDAIRYNDQTHVITAFNYLAMENGSKQESYKLNDSVWVLMQDKEYPNQASASARPIQMALCTIHPIGKELMAHGFEGKDSVCIRDTFRIYNYGNKRAEIKSNSRYFKVPTSIEPGETLLVLYERVFRKQKDGRFRPEYVQGIVQQVMDDCMITYPEHVLHCNVHYLMMNEMASQRQLPGGNVLHEVSHGQREIYQVYTDHQQVIAYGNTFQGEQRIGKWRIKDPDSGLFRDIQENKLLSLQLLNDTLSRCRVQLISVTDTQTIYPADGENYFVIQPAVHQIHIQKEERSIRYDISFSEIPEKNSISLYLLSPNEFYYYNNGVKVPLKLNSAQFYILFNSDYLRRLSLKALSAKQINTLYESELKAKFPHVIAHQTNEIRYGYKLWIDWSACKPEEIESLKLFIEKDDRVSQCRIVLQDHPEGSFTRDVLVYNSSYKPLSETLKNRAKNLGLQYVSTQSVNYQTHFFQWRSKWLDESFIKAYNELCEHAEGQQIHLNWDDMVELDDYDSLNLMYQD